MLLDHLSKRLHDLPYLPRLNMMHPFFYPGKQKECSEHYTFTLI